MLQIRNITQVPHALFCHHIAPIDDETVETCAIRLCNIVVVLTDINVYIFIKVLLTVYEVSECAMLRLLDTIK
jgi:hypothetical protein